MCWRYRGRGKRLVTREMGSKKLGFGVEREKVCSV